MTRKTLMVTRCPISLTNSIPTLLRLAGSDPGTTVHTSLALISYHPLLLCSLICPRVEELA